MVITKISADGFKNLKKVEIYPHEKMNIFCGKNAQGKTNLIEAIWLCSGVRSFRNTKDREMIDINGQFMNIDISFKNSFRSQDIHFAMARPNVREKNVTLNGVKLIVLFLLLRIWSFQKALPKTDGSFLTFQCHR